MSLSTWGNSVHGYIPKNSFIGITPAYHPTDLEIEAFIRLYIFRNIPAFIVKKPMAFDRIRQDVAREIGIHNLELHLTGSAQLGFSLNPRKELKEFDSTTGSDLDFFTISEDLFISLREELRVWKHNLVEAGNSKRASEVTEFERKADNRGFIHIWHMDGNLPTVKKCKLAMLRACLNLNELAGETVVSTKEKNASIRCYKNYESAVRQLRISIKDFIKPQIENL